MTVSACLVAWDAIKSCMALWNESNDLKCTWVVYVKVFFQIVYKFVKRSKKKTITRILNKTHVNLPAANRKKHICNKKKGLLYDFQNFSEQKQMVLKKNCYV